MNLTFINWSSAMASKTKKPTRAKKTAPKSSGRKPAKAPAKSSSKSSGPVAKKINERIKDLGDWRGKILAQVRQLIQEADPAIVEEWKWVKATSPGVPVWSHNGIICTGEAYKDKIKLTFAKGASLKDPARLFNSSLDGNVRRAIDIREGEKINEKALKALIRDAVMLNATRVRG
jgi:hypothetical protein